MGSQRNRRELIPVLPRLQQKMELFPDRDGEWQYGGYRFAGGVVKLGKNVDVIRGWRTCLRNQESANRGLEILARATVGMTNPDIAAAVNLSPHSIRDRMNGVLVGLGVPQRHMLLPAALRQGVFRLTGYGQAGVNFRASVYERAQLGLLARGIARPLVAQACGIAPETLAGDLVRMGAREGVRTATGCIAGAILTRQIGATTCIPLLVSEVDPGGVRPLMPVEEWEELVGDPNERALRNMFARPQQYGIATENAY